MLPLALAPYAATFFPCFFRSLQDLQHLRLDRFDALGKRLVVRAELVDAESLLVGQQLLHRFAFAGLLRDVLANRSAVRREQIDVVDVQAVARVEILQARHAVVAQVLVIDRVELAVIDQVFHVRRFGDERPGVFQNRRDARDEAVGVGDVRHHVVRVNDVRFLPFGGELLREVRA